MARLQGAGFTPPTGFAPAPRRGAALALALAGLLLLPACGADDSGTDVAENSGAADEGARPVEDAPSVPGGAGGQLVDPRRVIYTGALTVEVSDMPAAAAEAIAITDRYQGFLGSDRRVASADRPRATLELRIPSERFSDAVAELAALGEERQREIETEDVTDQVINLEARIATTEASLARTRELLDRAQSLDDIVAIERELSERESALAELQARQRELTELTSYSTIVVELVGPEAPGIAEEPRGPGFLTGLTTGWRGFTFAVGLVLTLLGFLLPWLVILGLPAAAVGWWLHRRRRTIRGPQPPSPAGPPLSP